MVERQPNVMCPYCKEQTGRKVGKIGSVSKGIQQRYKCRLCGRSWY